MSASIVMASLGDGLPRGMQSILLQYDTARMMEDVFWEQTIGKSTMLHITDGESVAGTLRESAILGQVSTYGDLMYEGPAQAGLDAEAWRDTRARFLAEAGYATPEQARQYLQDCEDT